MRSLLSIDPGSPFGYAFWGPNLPAEHFPEKTGVFQPWDVDGSDMRKWLARSKQAAVEFSLLVQTLQPQEVACEYPWFSMTSERSVAATEKGSIHKLCMNIGRIMEQCRIREVIFTPVQVMNWRGQLSDRQLAGRVMERIGAAEVTRLGIHSHAFDAVGIGLYVRTGRF